jgi:hypothetical protein
LRSQEIRANGFLLHEAGGEIFFVVVGKDSDYDGIGTDLLLGFDGGEEVTK